MLGKRTGLFAAAVVLLSRSVFAQIPGAFTSGFDVKSVELKATFGTKGLKDGDTLTPSDAAVLPKFELGGSSGISPKTKYIALMIDPDSPSRDDVVVPQVLHYLGTDFSVPEFTNLISAVSPMLKYVGPDASIGTGPHRYIFLLYIQPEGFSVKGVPDEGNRAGFNVSAWRELNNLKAAVAGFHFVATPPAGGAPAPTTLAVESKTTLVASTYTSMGVVYTFTPPPCTTTALSQRITKSFQSAPVQTKSPSPTNTVPLAQTSVPAAAKTHTVVVGGPNNLLKYTPETVIANVGDMVIFDFLEKNHTVTQSTFDSPCVLNPSGVKSGFRPNPQNIPGNQTFTFMVPNDKPQWFFCAQGKHCQAGMVFAVNPGIKFPEFVNKAKGGANATTTAAATGGSTSTAVVTKSPCTACTGSQSVTSGASVPTTLRPSGGIPVPSGNVSAPSASQNPVFTGSGSRVTLSGSVMAGVFLATWLFV